MRGIHRWPANSPYKGRNAENVSIWWRHHDNLIKPKRSHPLVYLLCRRNTQSKFHKDAWYYHTASMLFRWISFFNNVSEFVMNVTIVTVAKLIRLIDIWGVRKVPRSPNQANQAIDMMELRPDLARPISIWCTFFHIWKCQSSSYVTSVLTVKNILFQ